MTKKCTDCGVVVDSLKSTYNIWLMRNRDAEGNPIEVTEQSRSVESESDSQDTDTDKEAQSEPNEKQTEIDALTAQLETVTDKKERTKIKNRIQYLKRP